MSESSSHSSLLRRTAVFLILALLALSLAACSASSSPKTLVVSDSANRSNITLVPGQVLEVHLNRTYWHFAKPSSQALEVLAAPATSPSIGPGVIPGMHAGSTTASYKAIKGSASLTATARACGEAMNCVHAPLLVWTINVSVSP